MAASDGDKDGYEDKKDDLALIAEAKAFYTEDAAYEDITKDKQENDLNFSLGLDHWTGPAYDLRRSEDRPMLVIPRMNEFLNKVKNEQRQNKPSIKVSPAGAKSEEIQKERIKHAANRQGLIRHIQNDSSATQAYQTAYDSAVDVGRGWVRLITKYVSPDSFDQKAVIDEISNAFTVTPDRNRTKKDYRDMKRCFIGGPIPRERFKAEYPDAEASEWDKGNDDPWIGEDDLYLMEYYCIRYKNRVLYEFVHWSQSKEI